MGFNKNIILIKCTKNFNYNPCSHQIFIFEAIIMKKSFLYSKTARTNFSIRIFNASCDIPGLQANHLKNKVSKPQVMI